MLSATIRVLAIGSVLASPVVAQVAAPLQGVVADDLTSQLIPSATVTLVGPGLETRTGPEGGFTFPSVQLGPVSVRVEAPGYGTVTEEVEIVAGQILYLPIFLTPIAGDALVRVRVTDAASELPLAGAQVGLPELDRFVLTNEDGAAELTALPPGTYILEVTRPGYGPARALVELGSGSVADADVALGTGPIEIEGITVTAERWSRRLEEGGFYRREQTGIGHHLDRAVIERTLAICASDLLRTLPGVRASTECFPALGGGPGSASAFGGFGSSGSGMRIFVDGAPWNGALNDVPIGWIEGMEVYTRPSQIPAQYNMTGSQGGVILIWTR